jgi:Holliday junction resolvasome RuvABC endonuclease subunit
MDDMPPVGESAMADLLTPLLADIEPDLLVIERAGAPDSRSMKLGIAFEAVLSAARFRGIQIHIVAPNTWKAYFGLSSRKDDSRKLASRIWPARAGLFRRTQDHNRAEAALVALWGLHHLRRIL